MNQMPKDKKQMYRIIGQQEETSIDVVTKEIPFEQAKKIAIDEFLMKAPKFQPFVILSMTTEERWKERRINFCPRCGMNLTDQDLERSDELDCHGCNATGYITIHS